MLWKGLSLSTCTWHSSLFLIFWISCSAHDWVTCVVYIYIYTHTTILLLSGFCPGQPEWAGTSRNIHPLTVSWSWIILYLLPPSTTFHGILPVQVIAWQFFSTISIQVFFGLVVYILMFYISVGMLHVIGYSLVRLHQRAWLCICFGPV